jgi:hypothetical protein
MDAFELAIKEYPRLASAAPQIAFHRPIINDEDWQAKARRRPTSAEQDPVLPGADQR